MPEIGRGMGINSVKGGLIAYAVKEDKHREGLSEETSIWIVFVKQPSRLRGKLNVSGKCSSTDRAGTSVWTFDV